MGAVHGSPFWDQSQVTGNKVVQDGRGVHRWKATGLTETSALMYLYGEIMDKVFADVFTYVEQRTRTASIESSLDSSFSVDPTLILSKKMERVAGFEATVVESVRTIASAYIASKMNMGPMECSSSSSDVHPMSTAFSFDDRMSSAQLGQKKRELMLDYGSYIFQHLSAITPLGFHTYSFDDLAFLGGHDCPNPETLSCFLYAFLKVREDKAKTAIRTLKDIKPTLQLLNEWGYRSVERPDEGDLVVYFTNPDGPPQHIGIYCEDGQVESKWGLKSDAYKHPIFDVSPYFGRTVVFMRKSSAKLF